MLNTGEAHAQQNLRCVYPLGPATGRALDEPVKDPRSTPVPAPKADLEIQ